VKILLLAILPGMLAVFLRNHLGAVYLKKNCLGAVYLSSPFLLEAIFYSGKAENLSNSHL